MGTHVNPWLIHVNVWQKPLQYYKVISLQLIKINEKKKNGSFSMKEITRENNRFHYINKISIHMKYKTKRKEYLQQM